MNSFRGFIPYLKGLQKLIGVIKSSIITNHKISTSRELGQKFYFKTDFCTNSNNFIKPQEY